MAVNDEIPKSRITLTYRTQVNGEPVDKVLPFRMLLMGNFSRGSSVDQKKDLDQRQIRNLDGKNLNDVMKDMKMSLTLKEVKNRLTNDPEGGEAMDITLPITSMKSFTPVEIAQHIPKVKALLLLRKLLLEVQANLDNHKEFRQVVRELADPKNKQAVDALKEQFKGLQFGNLALPELPENLKDKEEKSDQDE